MHVLILECSGEARERLIAELWERDTAGVMEEDLPDGRCLLRAFFDAPFEFPGGAWAPAEAADWVEVSRSLWSPRLVGARLFLAPPWSQEPTPPGRLRLEFQPGTACGTGWHPATQLALEGLERCVRPGAAVLDVGTGSGLLAVAAGLLGAGRVLACDTDLEAVAVAKTLLRERSLPVELFAGSVAAVRSGSIDVVVANLEADTLIALAAELRRACPSPGALVLSGIPRQRRQALCAAFGPAEVLEREEWVALVC